jgi:hypothetical protein
MMNSHYHVGFYRQEALKSIMADIGSVLPIRQQLFNQLAALESLRLQSKLLINLSVIANIPANVIGQSDYGDIAVHVLVNHFESDAFFGSKAFSLELPLSLPSSSRTININLTDAKFSRDINVKILNPVDIDGLFPFRKDDSSDSFDCHGAFEALLPLDMGVSGVNIPVDLIITDPDLFDPNPVVDYAIDLCDVRSTMMDLFEQLKDKIVEAVRAPFGDKPVIFDIDRIADPLIDRLDMAIVNFTKDMEVTYSSIDCNSKSILTSAPSSFPSELPSVEPSLEPSSTPSYKSFCGCPSCNSATWDSSAIVTTGTAIPDGISGGGQDRRGIFTTSGAGAGESLIPLHTTQLIKVRHPVF